MDNHENTNWCQSVTGIVFHNNQVLLVRHTYGNGIGKLIIPGGYVNWNETPQEAVKREIYEETKVTVEPDRIVGIRFNYHDWYVAFTAKYISGEPVSDGEENSEAIWMDINEALNRDDVPDLTKKLIKCAMSDATFHEIPYQGNTKNGPYSLYGNI
ncbi:MAG TPA: NUDIX hydrolase [Mobilitalea sp.]|nr:NUDIX hydrolase [Mobilitalea sp.]